jgi:D-alanyl-lipoteichoic acid acyltransferase DltB (MBOAT superfamily)
MVTLSSLEDLAAASALQELRALIPTLWSVGGALAYAVLLQLFPRPFPNWVPLGTSLALSAVILGDRWPAFAVLSLVGYWAARIAARSGCRSPKIMSLLLVGVGSLFLTGRALAWDKVGIRAGPFEVAVFYCDMWMALRLLTLVWESGSQKVRAPALGPYALWVSNPLLLGGPLVRFSNWPLNLRQNRDLLRQRQWWLEVAGALATFCSGLSVAFGDQMLVASGFAQHQWYKGAKVLFFGPWSFYLTFAGQFALMRSLGRLCGVTVPTSFDQPFRQTNIAAFWARWNMTATSVFRDLVFYNRWGFRQHNIYINAFLVFLFVGLWHGSNSYWILFGMFHGVAFCLYLASRTLRQSIGDSSGAMLLSWALTYLCVCAAWYVPSKIVLFIWPEG